MTQPVDRSYRWLFLTLALVGFCADLGSKYGIFAALYNEGRGGKWTLIPGAFHLVAEYQFHLRETGTDWRARLRTISGEVQPRVNHGALFGLGNRREADGPDANPLFAVISIVAAVAITFWANRPATIRDRWLCAALGLILGGTLGNLYDRLLFHGVRDFLWWDYIVNWPVFNLADCCLVCGAGLLLLQAFIACPTENASLPSAQAVSEPIRAEGP